MSAAVDLQARAQAFLDADARMSRDLPKDEHLARLRARNKAAAALGSHDPALARYIIRAIEDARREGVA